MTTDIDILAAYDHSRRRDPLKHFQHRNKKLEAAMRWLGICMMYVHAGNRAGKTTWGAATMVALLRRLTHLAGVPLPELSQQVTGVLIVPSYKQAMGSSIQLVLDMIGEWPHELKLDGGHIQQIRVKQRGCTSDDSADWSVLWIYPADGTSPAGVNADVVWADEPPPIKMWREATFRRKAKTTFVAYITATPLNKHDTQQGAGWEQLVKQFPDECQKGPVDGRIRIHTSVYDNTSLTAADLRGLEQAARNDPLEAARLRGVHVDASGSCPFPAEVLDQWMTMTRPPDQLIDFDVQAERETQTGKTLSRVRCELEVWGEVDPEDAYLIVIDPARGIDDGKHDPDGLHIWSWRKRALVGRVNQYLGGWGIGNAAVQIAREFNEAQICVARGGSTGETVYSAIRTAQYHRLTSLNNPDSTSKQGASLGFAETYESRGRAIGALEQALLTADAQIPSADVIQCLKDCVIDPKGKIVAGPRGHDEDLICAGIALAIIQSRKMHKPLTTRPRTSADQFRDALDRSQGKSRINGRRPFHGHSDIGNWF